MRQVSRVSLQVVVDFFWGDLGLVPCDHVPLSVDEKLGEVPGDVRSAFRVGFLRLQEAVERAGTVSIDVNFLKYREVDVVVGLRKFIDLFVGSGLLSSELIAGEGEDAKAVLSVFFLEGTQTCVLGGEASLAGNVDDETTLTRQVCEGLRLSVDSLHREVVKLAHGRRPIAHPAEAGSTSLRWVVESRPSRGV